MDFIQNSHEIFVAFINCNSAPVVLIYSAANSPFKIYK